MSISVPAQSPGTRLRQLHDVALASPPATTALPLLYDPAAGRWKAQQIGTAGIADGAITFPKLDISAGNGFDGRWVNVTGDTMSNGLTVAYSGVPRISSFKAAGSLQRPAYDFERWKTTVGTVEAVDVGSSVGTIGFSASSSTMLAYGGAIYAFIDAPVVGGDAPISIAFYQSNRQTHIFDSYGRYFLNPPADMSGYATTPGLIVNGPTTMIGTLAINAPGAVALTLRGGGANDNTQLRFKGNASAVDQWAIGNMLTSGGTGRSFEIYDMVVPGARLTIKSDGRVTITPPSGAASSGLTLVEPGANDATMAFTSATAPRNWLVGVEGSRGAGTVGTAGSFFIHDATAGLSRLSINTAGDIRHWGNLTVDSTKQLSFYNEAKDDKIQLYSGYTLGIRGGTLGYFVNTGAIHNFFVNNASILQVTGSAILAQTSFQQSGGYAYLGSYNTGAGIYPRAGVDLAVGWNFTSGYREMALWNTDTAAAISFTFRQLQGSGQKLLTQIDANGRHTINGKLDVTSDFVSEPMFRVMNSGSTHLFGIWWNGAIILNSANVNGTTNTGFGAAPAAGHRHIQVMDQSYNTIGYIPIYS